MFQSLLTVIKEKEDKNRNTIKSFFSKVGFNSLYSLLYNNDILTKIKKDIVIQYLIDKGLFNSRTDMNSVDSIKILKGIGDEEFSIQLFNLDFKEIELSNGDKFQLNKEMIKKYLKSEAIISAVKEILSIFKDEKLNKVDKKVLEEKGDEYMNNTLFYSMKLNDKLFVFTIYNKSVFINDKYIKIALDKKNKQSLSAIAIILTTIFHEYIHYLIRVLPDKKPSNNYFLKTKHRMKNNNNKTINESGDSFDRLLIGSYNGFYSLDSEYLLDIKNYGVSFQLFYKGFIENNTNNKGKLDDESFLKRSTLDDSTFLKRPRCLFSFFVDDE